MKKLKILFVLLLFSLLIEPFAFASSYPIVFQKKTASSTGSLATPTYDVATVTLTNPFKTQPVEIIGTPTITITNSSFSYSEIPYSVSYEQTLSSTSTASTVANLLSRRIITIQNNSSSIPVWVSTVGTATVNGCTQIPPEGFYSGTWDSSVPISFVSSTTASICVTQGK